MSALCDHYRWLAGPQGKQWLAKAAESDGPLLAQLQRLRKAIGAQQARLVVQQLELRRRAAAKFPHPESLFFTHRGLEQASDHWIAAYKARRFPSGPVADLCAGIGGDLLALARRGPVVGVEIDFVHAILAGANLRQANPGAEWTGLSASSGQPAARGLIVVGDACHFCVAGLQAWHIDPDRRPAGRRTVCTEFSQPNLAAMESLRAVCADAAIKLAPACPVPQRWQVEAELEWIGRRGECRQLVAWFGRLAQYPGKRRATLVDSIDPGGIALRTLVGTPDCRPGVATRLGRYLFEPDATVLAAGLAGALAAEYGLEVVAAGSAYWTADHPVADPALKCFEVCDAMPLDFRRLRRVLASRGIGQLVIKKRGLPLDPESLRRHLAPRGPNHAVLVLTRRGRSALAILARPAER